MKWVHILPVVIIAESLGAALCYSIQQDWLHALYWLCSAGIVMTVTML